VAVDNGRVWWSVAVDVGLMWRSVAVDVGLVWQPVAVDIGLVWQLMLAQSSVAVCGSQYRPSVAVYNGLVRQF
jgi:hypothetical protein